MALSCSHKKTAPCRSKKDVSKMQSAAHPDDRTQPQLFGTYRFPVAGYFRQSDVKDKIIQNVFPSAATVACETPMYLRRGVNTMSGAMKNRHSAANVLPNVFHE